MNLLKYRSNPCWKFNAVFERLLDSYANSCLVIEEQNYLGSQFQDVTLFLQRENCAKSEVIY